MNNLDRQYFELVRRILDEGKIKENRTGISAYTIPGAMIQLDMEEGFPLMTSKFLPMKVIAVELEGFMKGITDKKWFQERGCFIWDEWCNPKLLSKYKFDESNIYKEAEEFLKNHSFQVQEKASGKYKEKIFAARESLEFLLKKDVIEDRYGKVKEAYRKLIQLIETDLGPIYGKEWVEWKIYNKPNISTLDNPFDDSSSVTVNKFNQLKRVIETLKLNPSDRRMLVSAWNVADISSMALPPCHVLWQVTVIDNTLNLFWYQRSVDVALGLPFNIASYGLLLELLAKESSLKPGILTGFLADTHIYVNHEDQLREQIIADAYPLPHLELKNFTSIFDWKHTDFELIDYRYFPARPFDLAI